jgi:transposase InsO family protein
MPEDSILGLSLSLRHQTHRAIFTLLVHDRTFAESGLLASMSRKGNCYDNAAMESFWSSLKTELQEERLDQLPKAEVRPIVFEYIEAYYNRRRLHSSLGYQSPVEFENQLSQQLNEQLSGVH